LLVVVAARHEERGEREGHDHDGHEIV
jgi:hypothetical protein